MKTHFKLLLLLAALVLVALCIAACGGTGGSGTTAESTTAATTTASATTTAATTTAPDTPPVAGDIHPGVKNLRLSIDAEGSPYTGKAINSGYGLTGWVLQERGKFEYDWSFQLIDAITHEPVAGVAPVERPVDAGVYAVTATLSWSSIATDADKVYDLPAPFTGTFKVTQLTIENPAGNLGYYAQDYEAFYYPGIDLEIANDNGPIAGGKLMSGLVRNYAYAKVDNAAGDNPKPMTGTVISDPGYFQVTITYTEENGKDNISNEQSVVHKSIVHLNQLDATHQVLKQDGIVIDGVIEDAYRHSATIVSTEQVNGWNQKDHTTYDETVAIVDPMKYVGMAQIQKGGEIKTTPDATVTLYLLWGEEVENEGTANEKTVPYVYVAIEIKDATLMVRKKEYTATLNSWLNDTIEFSYKMGGTAVPSLPNGADTYPIYSTVVCDARAKTVADHATSANHTAVEAQKSMYFDTIQSATTNNWDTDKDTYVVELKLPAKAESFEGTVGTEGFKRTAGEDLSAGDFLYICYQLNNLTGLPEKSEGVSYTIDEYDAKMPTTAKFNEDDVKGQKPLGEWAKYEQDLVPYMYCAGNRSADYLRTKGAGPAIFQLSEESYEVNIELDGVKDADYAKGDALSYVDAITEAPVTTAETTVVRFGDKVYIYTQATDAEGDDVVTYGVGGSTYIIVTGGALSAPVNGVTFANGSFAGGYAHEIVIDTTVLDVTDVTVTIECGDDVMIMTGE